MVFEQVIFKKLTLGLGSPDMNFTFYWEGKKEKDFSTVLLQVNAHMYSLHAQALRFDFRLKGISVIDVSNFEVTHVCVFCLQNVFEFELESPGPCTLVWLCSCKAPERLILWGFFKGYGNKGEGYPQFTTLTPTDPGSLQGEFLPSLVHTSYNPQHFIKVQCPTLPRSCISTLGNTWVM